MKRFLLATIVAGALLGACSTTGAPSPALRLYEAHSLYNVALTGAVAYAEGPAAAPGIVKALNAANKQAAPAVRYVTAYRLCGASQAGGVFVVAGVTYDCSLFTFNANNTTAYALALRSAATSMLTQMGARK